MRDLIRMTVILTLILCLPFNSVAVIDSSSQVEVEIIVDEIDFLVACATRECRSGPVLRYAVDNPNALCAGLGRPTAVNVNSVPR